LQGLASEENDADDTGRYAPRGQPVGLLGTQVRPLWQDHYRVNVFVGVDASSAKIAHSYFLVVDGEGTIIASTPKITRQY
jgi:hypothetical protein